MTAGQLKQVINALSDDTEVRIALDTWADPENPSSRELSRETRAVHFVEIRPRRTYAFLFLVHSELEESEEEERSL